MGKKKTILHILKIAIIPAIVFQAVLSGGGYASGREVVEFIFKYGSNSFYALLVLFLGFSVLLFFSIEIARTAKTYNYRSWAKNILGKYWILLDIIFIALALIAIAVITSASAEVFGNIVSFNYSMRVLAILLLLSLLIYFGEKYIVFFKSSGTISLYIVFLLIFFIILIQHPDKITDFVKNAEAKPGWFQSSLKYLGYNVIVIPATLFSFTKIETRTESIITSVLASLLGVIPIFLAIFILSADYPTILNSKVPIYDIIKNYSGSFLVILYYIALLITLIDTVLGLVHAITDRLADQFLVIKSKKNLQVLITLSIVILSFSLTQFGIINLVAVGYDVMAYFFIVICIIPLLIKGFKILVKFN